MTTLAATNNSFTLNLEAVGLLLGAVVSITILLSLLIAFTNRINRLETRIQYLQQELAEHANLEVHKVPSDKLVSTINNLYQLEKALDIHLQDYTNRKDLIQYMLGQLDQKVEHKFSRLYHSMRDMEKFLQKSHSFKIREYFDSEEK